MSEEKSLPEEKQEESTALCAIVFYNNKFVEIYNKDATLQDICEALGIDVFNTEAYIVDRTTRHAVATLPSDCLPTMNANTPESRQENQSTAHEQGNNNNTTFVDFWGEANADDNITNNITTTNNISVTEEDQENEEGVQKKVKSHIVLEYELVTPNLHETSSEHQSEESEYEEESEENTERQNENRHDEVDEQHEEYCEHNNMALSEFERAHSSTPYAMEDGIDNDGGGDGSRNKIDTQALSGNQEGMQALFKLARKWHAVSLLTAELPHRLATLPHYDPTTSAANLLTGIVYHAGMYNPHRPQYDPLFDSDADCASVGDRKGNALYVNSVEPYCIGSSVSSVLAQRPDIHPLTTEELEQIYRHHSSTDKKIIDV